MRRDVEDESENDIMLLRIISSASLIRAEMMLHYEPEGRWTAAGLAFDFYDPSIVEISSAHEASIALHTPYLASQFQT